MAATAVTLCGIELENPIIPASGTFGYGQEFAQLYDINMLGTFSFKGTTRAPRFGNPTPRIAEYAGGMLNAVGLQNPGVDAVIAHELPELKKVFHKPVMANVSGFSVEEYAEVCARLDAQPQVGWLEVNISCPNVKAGGATWGVTCEGAASVTKAVRAATSKPLIVKLTPNVTNITEIAKAVEAEGADSISMINTLLGMRIDIRTKRPILHNNVGGLSGPAIFPVAVRMVWQCYNAVKIPIIGMGGISTWEDAVEMMMAGASAIQMGTAIFTDPWSPIKVIEGLNDSKKLSEKKREKLFDEITENALAWSVSLVDERVIDEINILQATFRAMRQAVDGLTRPADFVYVDGNRSQGLDLPHECVVSGDAKIPSVAAASIIAKVTRDRLMRQFAEQYPQYGFEKHKGYETRAHDEALLAHGPCPIHRMSFLKKFYEKHPEAPR